MSGLVRVCIRSISLTNISDDDMLYTLIVNFRNIQSTTCRKLKIDLNAFTAFPNLRQLELRQCEKINISVLSVCDKLETLRIFDSPLTNILGVSRFPTLKELHLLHCNSLKDVTWVLFRPRI